MMFPLSVLKIIASLNREFEIHGQDAVVVGVPRSEGGGWHSGYVPGSRLHMGLSSLVTGNLTLPMQLVDFRDLPRCVL